MTSPDNTFYFVYSSSLDVKIQIKIGTLEGVSWRYEYDKMLEDEMLKHSGLYQPQKNKADLMVITQVFSDGRPISLPVSTSYKSFTNRWNWSEWVTLPLMFSDLPRNALLCLTIYDCIGPSNMKPVGGTTISLFGKHGVFRQGMMDLQVWRNQVADGSPNTKTPGKHRDEGKNRMQHLSKLTKKHRNGQMPRIDWLDRLTFREIEVIYELEKRTSNYLYLMVEFPQVIMKGILHSVVCYEQDGDEAYPVRSQADIVTIPDPEVLQDNLVEDKNHKLARSLRSGDSDKDAKPNATVRDVLNTIVAYPPTKPLTTEEQDLVWKFRFYLSNQKKALIKFLKCVNWNLSGEAQQAVDMMEKWAPMDVEDSLELLSPAFTHATVRRYAISRLQQAPDEDLLLYLLQLVQALKYENFDDINKAFNSISISQTAVLLTEASIDIRDSGSDKLMGNSSEQSHDSRSTPIQYQSTSIDTNDMHLASFIIHRACNNMTLANYFYWYLILECEDKDAANKQDSYMNVHDMYLKVKELFLTALKTVSEEGKLFHHYILRQQTFIEKLVNVMKSVARESGNRKKKMDKLKFLLADTETFKMNFTNFEPLPFPLDPSIKITGIIPEKATLFKSAMMPSRLTFLTTEGEEYVAIFKNGDDLRQDQLVLQFITLMDKLLRSENLDLKLTPYRVLATSTKTGFVQFIQSLPITEVLATEHTIQNFFRKHHPSATGPYGITSEIMDTYVKSCAGYCIITYLLGVGDRHLDNLLLTNDGKLFHIDFGYILGRDPRPLPPPMKLSKEMVEAMGGVSSEHYHQFRKLCYTIFLHLRRHANLILNLFSLMANANVPDIALEPDKAVRKVQDKLRLDLGDEEACTYLQNLLDESVTALMAAVVEQLHKIAQYMRN
ncbi:phosphatidylinositol 3-kinase catalytic subunit type 3 isoform X1 [Nilaparvata lugens]|uniref:phosphatidylinositol 3-kinase catalytic subunit type 3 isoform X1 n=1 Tax=Nilaparvata lugens TaxID=108931 RepID=UPI00193CDE82|nr:phosphatidylinositol 3-kinase catalytic subunit type 3 isoform X1 [Nilaparvata lugens]